jgi:type IV secretory pathway VirB3-like protein
MESSVIQALITQSPGMAAIIIVVILFLRSIKDRDQLFIDQMNKIVERLQALETLIVNHDANSKDAWTTRKDTLEKVDRKLDAIQKAQLRKKPNGS